MIWNWQRVQNVNTGEVQRHSLPSAKISAKVVSTLCVLCSGATNALDEAHAKAGPFLLTPTLKAEWGYDDNVLYQPDDELGSQVVKVEPGILAEISHSAFKAEFDYLYKAGRYTNSENDDYDDQHFRATGTWTPLGKHFLELEYRYKDAHEPRGTGYSAGTGATRIDTPDLYTDSSGTFKYVYGAQKSGSRTEIRGGSTYIDYTNNFIYPRARDRKIDSVGATFYVGIFERTDALFSYDYWNVDYSGGPWESETLENQRNSENQRWLLGLEWDATSTISGVVSAGQEQKTFESRFRDDFSGLSWKVALKWKPRTYSGFAFETARVPKETEAEGDFIDTVSYAVSWDHNWSSRFSTDVKYEQNTGDYVGSLNGREDDYAALAATLTYHMRRWLEFDITTLFSDNTPTVAEYQYDRDYVGVNVKMSL